MDVISLLLLRFGPKQYLNSKSIKTINRKRGNFVAKCIMKPLYSWQHFQHELFFLKCKLDYFFKTTIYKWVFQSKQATNVHNLIKNSSFETPFISLIRCVLHDDIFLVIRGNWTIQVVAFFFSLFCSFLL